LPATTQSLVHPLRPVCVSFVAATRSGACGSTGFLPCSVVDALSLSHPIDDVAIAFGNEQATAASSA